MYNGYKIVQANDEDLTSLYEGNNVFDLLTNQYLAIIDENKKIIDRGRWNGNSFSKLNYLKIKDFKPLSIKQEFLCDLLSNHDIPIKIIAGVAGSGKTKIAMTYGFHYLSKSIYNKFFVVRHNVPVGERNGYLPGGKLEKIMGWFGFFEDNLDGIQHTVQEMVSNGMLDIDSPEYMKGRDIKNSWILVDEAEDLTEDQFKMIGERVSIGSQVCFVGDYDQVTQTLYKNNCGLKRAINKLSGNSKVGVVVFDDIQNDNVRSETSKIFSYLY